MQPLEIRDFDSDLPNTMPIAVVMEKKPSDHPWLEFVYRAIGVVSTDADADADVSKVFSQEGIDHYLFTGLRLQLHVDECESYYHNLMSPYPGCFIVAGETDDHNTMPEPYLVSLSFDEVHSYLEGDETVYAVDIPPELYKWTEAFVLQHYVATKRRKRKLTNWKDQANGRVVLHHDKQ